MKKIFQNRAVAWILLILVAAGAVALGLARKEFFESKKQTKLLDVKYYTWVCDSASLLSEDTVNAVKRYDSSWNSQYEAVSAVATLPRLNRWEIADYANSLGEKWKLGSNDMLLLLVKDSNWYISYGEKVSRKVTSGWEKKFKSAIEEPFFTGDFDGAVMGFLMAADEFYSSVDLGGYTPNNGSIADILPIGDFTDSCRGTSVIKLIVIIFVIVIIIKAVSKGGGLKRSQSSPVRRTTIFPVFIPPIITGSRSAGHSAGSRTTGGSYRGGSSSNGFGSGRGSFGGTRGSTGSSRGGFGKGGFGGGRR